MVQKLFQQLSHSQNILDYILEECLNSDRAGSNMDQFPWPRFDRETAIRDAGFNPNDPEIQFGLFDSHWKVHRPDAFVIYTNFNLTPGTILVISNETLDEADSNA